VVVASVCCPVRYSAPVLPVRYVPNITTHQLYTALRQAHPPLKTPSVAHGRVARLRPAPLTSTPCATNSAFHTLLLVDKPQPLIPDQAVYQVTNRDITARSKITSHGETHAAQRTHSHPDPHLASLSRPF
jgi:hypothetical protein